MKNKQLFSAILCGILSAATLVSCGQTEAVSSADTTTAAPETTTSPYVDSLPEKDYGGDTFTTLIRTEWAYEFDIPEQNGEIINDAEILPWRSASMSTSNSFRLMAHGMPDRPS